MTVSKTLKVLSVTMDNSVGNAEDSTFSVEYFLTEAIKLMNTFKSTCGGLLAQFEQECEINRLKLLPSNKSKTLEELIIAADKSQKDISENTTSSSTFSRKRSISCIIEDEGYITEESRNKKNSKLRSSRSLSRTHISSSNKTIYNKSIRNISSASTRMSRSRFKTPAKGFKPINGQTYGLITPKVAPNTTLSILRRPMQGEMAVSLAGSPLLVSNMTNDDMANVNIPMTNGTVLSLLPTHMGKIDPKSLPKLDLETRKQLQVLADNLNKIVSMAK